MANKNMIGEVLAETGRGDFGQYLIHVIIATFSIF
jgi:hypothetical protein